MAKIRVMPLFGTRPEAIKLVPVITELRRERDVFDVRVVVTAQHRSMLDQVLRVFDVRPDVDLDIMRPGQTLTDVSTRALNGIEKVISEWRPDIVLVQGDTTTAFAGALAAYYQKVRVGHVEAGLRTKDKFAPYPEEMNRRLIGCLADLHFAPTQRAKENLRREGVRANTIYITGNTVIDALFQVLSVKKPWRLPVLDRLDPARRVLLVTAHRRESFGPGFRRICQALATIARRNEDVEIVYPVHLNPSVRKPVMAMLGNEPRIHLIEPLEYLPFAHLMKRSYLILSDSGGIQEEAPALGKPVLVLRDKTERPEAIEAGTAKLVGTDVKRIVAATERLLRSGTAYRRMAHAENPFGDGKASKRISRVLARLGDHAG